MKKLCLLLSILACLWFLIGSTNAYSNNEDATIGSITGTDNRSGGMRFIYQFLPVDAKYKNHTTIFYKDINLKMDLRGDYECEFDTANMYGLEFFKINGHRITFGGLYMDSITASSEMSKLRANAFMVGFGMGYTTKHDNPIKLEISPSVQVGGCRYVTTFDDEITDDEVSDWGLCWQGGLRGSLIFVIDPFEFGVNAGYMYYSQNFERNNKTTDIEEVAEFDVTGSGISCGLTLAIDF